MKQGLSKSVNLEQMIPAIKEGYAQGLAFLPDGRPAPAVMTSDEVVEFLRLDGKGERTIKYYRDTGKITGVRIGRKVRYPLPEVLRFVSEKIAENRGNGSVCRNS